MFSDSLHFELLLISGLPWAKEDKLVPRIIKKDPFIKILIDIVY